LLAGVANAQPYQVINTTQSVVGGDLIRTVLTVQEGNNPVNRFFITRVEKPKPNSTLAGVIVMLPPLGSGFQNYEASADGDYNNSFAGYLARRNYALVGYSRREDGLPAGACESGVLDCGPMADWGLQTMVDDIAFIRQHVTQEYPGFIPKIGGLSAGSIAAMATLSAYPNDYSGAILIEGTLHDTDPAVQAINAGFCAQHEATLAAGVYYDGQSGPGIKFLSQLAQNAPNQPNMLPGFPPGLTNHQAFVLALSATPLSPLSPRPGYFNLAGNFVEDRFFFANEPLVHANIATFVNYTTIRSLRDLNCGLAGETTFTNNLASYTGPVLMFAAGHGFGPAMLDTAQLMSSADVTIKFNGDYGHVDYMFSTNHIHELEQPILKWLRDN
jgi:pimeloyl-ACP methyl ester carboxylesterase